MGIMSCLALYLVVVEVVLRGGRVGQIGELPVGQLDPQDGEEAVEQTETGLLLGKLHQVAAHKLEADSSLRILRLLLLLQQRQQDLEAGLRLRSDPDHFGRIRIRTIFQRIRILTVLWLCQVV